MVDVLDVLNELEKSFRVLFPNIKRVHLERIKTIEGPSLSVEVVSYKVSPFSEHIVNKRLGLDIIYLSGKNTIKEGLIFADRLKDLLGLGLKVEDRFLKILEPPDIKFVDQDIHFLVEFDFDDEYKPVTVSNSKKVVEISQGETDLENLVDDYEHTKDGLNDRNDLMMMEDLFVRYKL